MKEDQFSEVVQLVRPLRELRELARPYYLRWWYFRRHPERMPQAFRSCWQYSSEVVRPDDSKPIQVEPPAEDLCDILFLPMTDWHERTQRTQQLALHLAELGHRCFLLNPHLGRQYSEAPTARRDTRVSKLAHRLWELHVALRREPVFHHRLLRKNESRQLADEINGVLKRIGTRRLSLIVSLPTWFQCAEQVKSHFAGRLLYDCHDWLAGFSNMGREVVRMEAAAMRGSDAVIFSSHGLQREFEGLLSGAVSMTLVRNGVPEWPPSGSRTREAVAGYIGAIEEWFDIEMMETAAKYLPAVRFVLAGRASIEAMKALGRYSNVVFAGEIPHEQVPGVCASLRVGIIPFRRNRLVDFADPIKLYEYFHFGLPVVCSRMRELDEQGDLVYQAENPDDFVKQIYRALAEDREDLERRRKELSRASTWHRRAQQVEGLLSETFVPSPHSVDDGVRP